MHALLISQGDIG